MLLAADPLAVSEVIADTHYGGASTRTTLAAAGIELTAPAQPATTPKGLFNKTEFGIDLENCTVTCPAGVTLEIKNLRASRLQVRFGASCSSCGYAAGARTMPGAAPSRSTPPRNCSRQRAGTMDAGVPSPLQRTRPCRAQERPVEVPHGQGSLARPREGRRLGEDQGRGDEPRPDRPDPRADRVSKPVFLHAILR